MRKVNYHTHTRRCHHAIGSDEEYVLAAIQAGIQELGFTDHTPWHYNSSYVSGMRMKEQALDHYLASLRHLKAQYADKISLKIGLECEYFPSMMTWLRNMLAEKEIDYIILGNHFHESDEYGWYYGHATDRPEILRQYVQDVKEAMATGLYSYIAHPDLIHYVHFEDEHYHDAMRDLCMTAKAKHIPLEFNLLGFKEKRHYPCMRFWEIAAACGCEAIIGFDAHEPARLLDEKTYLAAEEILNHLGIKIIDQIRFLK